MGTQAYQLQHILVGFPVDEDQIGPEVTIPMVTPVPGQWMIAVPRVERPVIDERFQHLDQDGIQRGAVSALRTRL